jgi:hypothetical protein
MAKNEPQPLTQSLGNCPNSSTVPRASRLHRDALAAEPRLLPDPNCLWFNPQAILCASEGCGMLGAYLCSLIRPTSPLIAVLTIILTCGPQLSSQIRPPSSGQNFSYTGRVTAAVGGRPIANANVLLYACGGPPKRGNPLFATTAADGSYRFAKVPWVTVAVRVTHAGFVPGGWGICASPDARAPASIDVALLPAAIPVPMKDGPLSAAYGKDRIHLRFSSATLNGDSTILRFVTEDCHSGNCLNKGWQYDLRTQTLEPGPMPAYNANKSSWSYDPTKPPKPPERGDSPFLGPPEWRTIGAYQITFDANISHGCDDTVSARKPGEKEFVVTRHSCGWLPSPDGTVMFWSAIGDNRLWAFNFESRRKDHVVLPKGVGDFLAAGRDHHGFLVAFDFSGSCLGDNSDFIRLLESSFSGPPPTASQVCFVHVPAPNGR